MCFPRSMCIFSNTWSTCFHSNLLLIIYPGLCMYVLLYHRGIQHFQRGKYIGKGCIFKEVKFSSLPFQQVPPKCFLSTLLRGYRNLRKVTLGRREAGICCWVKSFEDVIGNKVWGRDHTVSAREIHTNSNWALLLYLAQRILSFGVSAEKPAVMAYPWRDLQWDVLFPTLSLFSRAALSLFKMWTHCIPSSCFPRPNVSSSFWSEERTLLYSCYQIQRLIDINKGNESTLAVVIVHTFLGASEIYWWLDIWK